MPDCTRHTPSCRKLQTKKQKKRKKIKEISPEKRKMQSEKLEDIQFDADGPTIPETKSPPNCKPASVTE